MKHHNILQLVDSFETKKEYFIFLELWVSMEALDRKGFPLPVCCCLPAILIQMLPLNRATGREVFDWILDQGYYSERDTSNVMRQVLEAVAYLHSLKIVHRNLKVNKRQCWHLVNKWEHFSTSWSQSFFFFTHPVRELGVLQSPEALQNSHQRLPAGKTWKWPYQRPLWDSGVPR